MQHEKHLVLVGVRVLIEGPNEFSEFHFLPVERRDDSWRSMVGEVAEFVIETRWRPLQEP